MDETRPSLHDKSGTTLMTTYFERSGRQLIVFRGDSITKYSHLSEFIFISHIQPYPYLL
jgi:hypothetical protein